MPLAAQISPIVQDLPSNSKRMAEFVAHVREREGVISYFYCDNMGFVTIGSGHLVKTQHDARELAASGIHKATKKVASSEEIIADWQLVYDNKGLGRREYSRIAELRLTERAIHDVMIRRLVYFCRALYKAKPFIKYYDTYIAMALVDTRYNSAGLHPWAKSSNKAHCDMWLHLDPCDATGDWCERLAIVRRM
jgi:hypothetical protein